MGWSANLENAVAHVELALDYSGCSAASRTRFDVVFEDEVLHVALYGDASTLEGVSAPSAMSWQSNHENHTVVTGRSSSEALGVQLLNAPPCGVMLRELSPQPRAAQSASAGRIVKAPPWSGLTVRKCRSSKLTMRVVSYRRARITSAQSASPSSRSA